MKLKLNNKGVSLPMVIGLFLLLMLITVTMNELVIRALKASHQIEASDKAYFAAEAGIEDALYELSGHGAGYQTTDLSLNEARQDDFGGSITWRNQWEIKSKNLNECALLKSWESGFSPTYCGKIYGNEKLILNLFTDDALSNAIGTSAVNETQADINTLNISNIEVKFRLPPQVVEAHPGAWASGLLIDNDYDLGKSADAGEEAILGLNEDGGEGFGFAKNPCDYSSGLAINDNDCDGREDEDSKEDRVVLWKLIDDQGNFFQPLRDCKGDPPHPSHGTTNAALCEKNFTLTGNELSVSLNQSDLGVDQTGAILDLQTFLSNYFGSKRALQMEILMVAPMRAIDVTDGSPIPLPYYEYGIEYDAGGQVIPATYFSIKSDGFFRDFKQSITTRVIPGGSTRLLDLTIIQQ